ncbi:MAG: glutamate--tRNA ligase family protein, partial [Candidatus Pacebacteria bacterium]|nr:glutamate--tRNA ligase family protein [Candidatus Paceibacterota bacterium]
RALGFEIPAYAHLPLILMPDKSKMSKRKHETSVKRYREMGILPQAILNYLALLGWTPPSGKEMLSVADMIAEFDLADLHKSGAVFDIEKLRWFNREYLLKMRDDDFAAMALERLRTALEKHSIVWDESIGLKLLPLLRERISLWDDIDAQVGEGEYDYFFVDPQSEPASIPQKNGDPVKAIEYLTAILEILQARSDTECSDPEKIKAAIWPYAEAEGRGNVLWPLRYSLSGRAKSPDPFLIASIVGKESAIRRVSNAIGLLKRTTQ